MYQYKATLVRAVDGDTAILLIDLGFHLTEELDFRLLHINAPEMHGATMQAALAAKAELERLCGLGPLRASTAKTDKYGRWLVQLDVLAPDGTVAVDVNQSMIDGGFAVPYMTLSHEVQP